jgi:hypothetical protein
MFVKDIKVIFQLSINASIPFILYSDNDLKQREVLPFEVGVDLIGIWKRW